MFGVPGEGENSLKVSGGSLLRGLSWVPERPKLSALDRIGQREGIPPQQDLRSIQTKAIRLPPRQATAQLKRSSPGIIRAVELRQVPLNRFTYYGRKSFFSPMRGELE